jgi:hypothetical protein
MGIRSSTPPPEEASMSTEPSTADRSMTSEASASPLDSHASPVAGGRTSNRATAALVVAIIAVVVALVIPIGGIVLGVVAIVLSSRARDQLTVGSSSHGKAKAAFIVGIVAVVLAIVSWIAAVAILSS